ncbi:MAG TPA: glycosyltransferase family 9 protein [Herpetosiphonaceae bacterium]|nr:glycosyltransferase family 9 protein [Herpetosiphonaceae bacterium]
MLDRTIRIEGPVRRIAVFRALFLGDLICALPAFRALAEGFPEAEITLIGLPWASEFIGRIPYIHRFETFSGFEGIMEVPYVPDRTRAFVARARKRRYDIALQMHGSGAISNGFAAGLGSRLVAGYRNGPDERLDVSLQYHWGEHEVLRWLRLVEALGVPAGIAPVDFAVTAVERREAARLLSFAPDLPGPVIGLHTGAKDPARRWPAKHFARLADLLIQHYGARIVLTGSEGERETTEAVRGMMRCPALDLAGKTSLGTFVALIARLGLLVTNDTGASHVAALTRTRSVSLFGPSRPEEWAPLDRKQHRVIDALKHGEPNTDPVTALAQLPVEPVVEACDEQLCPVLEEGSTNVAGKNGAPCGRQRYVEASWSG